MLFLYNTGARVSEALAIRAGDLRLERPRQVRLLGKGQKERICPLWSETALALRRIIPVQGEQRTFLFRNASGAPLTRDGVAYLLAQVRPFRYPARSRAGKAACHATRDAA